MVLPEANNGPGHSGDMVGQTISHYRILEKLGGGGMGVVYRAEDINLQRTVVLKFLPPELTRSESAKRRFIREAQAASALDHLNICTIHEVDETEAGQVFIVMTLYDGETLKQKISRGLLAVHESLDIAVQVCAGLAKAHGRGIIHRDIKPANIMVTSEGIVKIIDFGLAKLAGGVNITTAGQVRGTAAYMSPEQIRGDAVDQRTDVWSLGVLLYEMLAGHPPFRGEYEHALLYSIVCGEPSPLSESRKDLPEGLEEVVNTCLKKESVSRYQSVTELWENLKPFLPATESAPARGFAMPATMLAARLRRSRRLGAVLAGVLLVLLAFFLLPSTREAIKEWSGFSPVPELKHLVVLPFNNIGGDPANQPLCDGLVEILTSKITQLELAHSSLWVIPAIEVRQRQLSSIGQAHGTFGVTLIVTGSVQRENHRIRLATNLIDATSLRQIRSSVFDDQLSNLSRLQDAVAVEVARMLELELEPRVLSRMRAGETLVNEAFDLYLRGRGYLQRYERIENIDMAIRLFQKALVEDPDYALASAALGEAYWRKYEATKTAGWVDAATQSCQRALALDNRLVSAHVTLGMVYRGTGNYESAITELLQALHLDPVSADAHRELAATYSALGELEKTESTYKKAIALRPGYWAGYNTLGVFYFRHGRYEEAAAQFKQVIKVTPDNIRGYANLGGVFFLMKRWRESREMFEHSLEIEPNYQAYSNLGTLYYYEERYKQAAEMLEHAMRLRDTDYRLPGNLAGVYGMMHGQPEKRQAMLLKAAAMAENQLKVNPRDATVLADLSGYYGALGKFSEARRLLDQATAIAPNDVEVLNKAAKVWEEMGNRARALHWIERALAHGYSLAEIEHDPQMRDLRSDPAFRDILERTGR